MKKLKEKGGFTLVELMVVTSILFIIFGIIGFGVIGGLCMGNFWVTEDSALKAVNYVNKDAKLVTRLDRHVWGYSQVTVENGAGQASEYYLDANILQNIEAIPITN